MNALTLLLTIIEIAANAAKGFGGDVNLGATAADAIIKIAQAANLAHLQLTGQPIDLSKLEPIAPVE